MDALRHVLAKIVLLYALVMVGLSLKLMEYVHPSAVMGF